MTSFQYALERGEAKHLMPVDPERWRRGEIALKDVPYMQRGGGGTTRTWPEEEGLAEDELRHARVQRRQRQEAEGEQV